MIKGSFLLFSIPIVKHFQAKKSIFGHILTIFLGIK